MSPLVKLWQHESGWNHKAENSGSGAYGIPQALPGSKMAKFGDDWRTNPRHADQVRAWTTSRTGTRRRPALVAFPGRQLVLGCEIAARFTTRSDAATA